MSKNLLKEAIADAKAVRETAIANAKLALEEAFTPKLQSMLSAKISEEMDDEELEDEVPAEDEVAVEGDYAEDAPAEEEEEIEEAEHEEAEDEIPAEEEEVTEGGILLPDTVDQGKLMEGEVVSVGKGMYSANGTLIPVVVNVGETVLYNKHAQLHEYDDDLVIMSVNEILSIVEEVG